MGAAAEPAHLDDYLATECARLDLPVPRPGERPVSYMKRVGVDEQRARTAYLVLHLPKYRLVDEEGAPRDERLREAKRVWMEKSCKDELKWRASKGHTRAMSEHWLRRRYDFSGQLIDRMLEDAAPWAG